MKYNSINVERLGHEKIQLLLRYAFTVAVLVHFSYFHFYQAYPFEYPFNIVIAIPLAILFINLLYTIFIFNCPFCFQNYRIFFILTLDVLASVSVMYLSGAISVYYPFILLWYVIGYSIRYGKQIGTFIYLITLLGWSLLLMFSNYWSANLDVGTGWFIAFLIIPLYFFKMLTQLHDTIAQLHQDVDTSMYQAAHDPLTDLPNRFLFDQRLQEYAANFSKHSQKFALFFMDLDGFKQINDMFGHDKGDMILVEVAKKMKNINEETYRLGGDEFVSIVAYENKEELKERADILLKKLQKQCENSNLLLSVSIGIACYFKDNLTTYQLKKHADLAMYAAKQEGKNKYRCYNSTAC